jgi:hypothetical protein
MLDTFLKWAGTALTIAGALATALRMDPLNVALLNLGSILWLVAAIRMKEASLVVINGALLGIYVTGAVIRLSAL